MWQECRRNKESNMTNQSTSPTNTDTNWFILRTQTQAEQLGLCSEECRDLNMAETTQPPTHDITEEPVPQVRTQHVKGKGHSTEDGTAITQRRRPMIPPVRHLEGSF